jgi:uncharacterized protein (DUF1330 family)/ketosteroid isomerase-like protein
VAVPKGYVILTEDVRDQAAMREYGRVSAPSLGEHDGRVLVMDDSVEVLEGTWHGTRTVVVEFPSVEQARRWYASSSYQAALPLGQASADSRVVIAEGFSLPEALAAPTTSTSADSPAVAVVREYFRRSDARQADVFDLLHDDIEFHWPKFGVGRGKRQFAELAMGLGKEMEIFHDQETLRFLEAGDQVVVEGTTYGRDAAGRTWRGGETPGGRFCCVYQIRDGLIARSYIYADPDYPSRDREGFLWGTDRSW